MVALKIINSTLSAACRDHHVLQLGNLLQLGLITFAPNTSEVAALVDHMSSTHEARSQTNQYSSSQTKLVEFSLYSGKNRQEIPLCSLLEIITAGRIHLKR